MHFPTLASRWSRRTQELLLAAGGLLAMLALWEGLSRTGLLNQKFFPPPTQIAGTLGSLMASGKLPKEVGISSLRVVEGFLVGAAPAVLLGMALGFSRHLRALLMPVATVVYTLPKIAIYPMVIVVLGLGEGSKIAIVAISVFFLVLLNTMTGVVTLERAYWDVGRNFGASPSQMLRTIAFPGALPLIFAGFKLAMGFGLVVIVGAEFLGARSGIGSMIWLSYQTFRLDEMYAGLVATAAMGLFFHWALDALERRLIPWKAAA